MNKELLTTKGLAEYLRINENQIYRLIRGKKLPATRITGKWLFPKELIDEWITSDARKSLEDERTQSSLDRQIVIAGSNDLALELLAKNAYLQHQNFTVSLSSVGSLAGLVALRNRTCHIAASHLLDTETGEYNSPYIKKQCLGLKVISLNLAHREQGLVLKRGNPLGIKTIKDLAVRKAVFVNRQEGSGTRVLLDYRLKELGIDPLEIAGYSRIAYTHMEVALAVFKGSADAGIAIQAVAKILGLDFVPLATERFDLVIPTEFYSSKAVRAFCDALRSEELKSGITRMGGYETYETGKVVYEKE
ncbi:MAG TPA: substrate-binding domain-containing protein [Acidobacteriota bacterium]|nr:substrate-binding domain-containing protein [Acidobacteriota bacterium]